MNNVITCTSFASSLLSFSGWTGRALEAAAHTKRRSESSFILALLSVQWDSSLLSTLCASPLAAQFVQDGLLWESAVDWLRVYHARITSTRSITLCWLTQWNLIKPVQFHRHLKSVSVWILLSCLATISKLALNFRYFTLNFSKSEQFHSRWNGRQTQSLLSCPNPAVWNVVTKYTGTLNHSQPGKWGSCTRCESHAKKSKLWRNYCQQKICFLNWSIKWDWLFWETDENPKSLPATQKRCVSFKLYWWNPGYIQTKTILSYKSCLHLSNLSIDLSICYLPFNHKRFLQFNHINRRGYDYFLS